MSLAGKKWSEGITKPSLRTYLLEENHLKCLPPLAHDEVLGIVGRVSAYKPGQKKFLYSWREQFRDSYLPSNCKLVLFVLAEHMDAYGKSCYPTQTQIALEASLNRKTIRSCLKNCVESGWITRYTHSSNEQEYWNYGYIARLPDG